MEQRLTFNKWCWNNQKPSQKTTTTKTDAHLIPHRNELKMHNLDALTLMVNFIVYSPPSKVTSEKSLFEDLPRSGWSW